MTEDRRTEDLRSKGIYEPMIVSMQQMEDYTNPHMTTEDLMKLWHVEQGNEANTGMKRDDAARRRSAKQRHPGSRGAG